MLFAEVAVEAARGVGRETYTYSVPPDVEVVPGHRVRVPFGRRTSSGYVVSLGTEPPGLETRPIEHADRDPLLLPHQVEMARVVAEHYWVPVIECLRAMVPPRIRRGRSTGEGPSSRQHRHSPWVLQAAAVAEPDPGPRLTVAQVDALAAVRDHREVLILGVTASGKTEVYIGAAAETIEAGQRVLLLVPEISLTPQLIDRLRRRLGARVAVLHSQLTDLERAQQWWSIRRGEPDLIVGSRSAVFAPIPRLGLVCVDEEGSSAYKQERTPRYEAGWVARRLAQVTGARLLMGSATPRLSTYHEAVTGRITLTELPERVTGRAAPVQLVDMRDEFAAGNRMPLTRRLVALLDATLQREEQSILFLNRRGLATFVMCRECGRSVECPDCSVAMVQHGEIEGLSCHYCGYHRPLPATCPYCGSRQIRGLGMGTQRLEGLVRRLWPSARVLRLDSDVATRPDAYFEVFETFAAGRADILVGTQLVARGLDLEGVTAVGVVDADLPLHFPDYRSAENTFALVTQVAGRAGRRQRPAQVVVQTSNPDHYSLQRAAAGDYAGFYSDELPSRRAFSFPPFADLVVLTYSDSDPERAAGTAREAADGLASALVRERVEGIRLLGPSPAFIHKLRGQYRWQLTIKGADLGRVRSLVPGGRGWSYDIDP